METGTCQVHIVESNRTHIPSAREIFEHGARNATYQGEKLVRGIWCDHWHSDFEENNILHHYDYYFSVESWRIRGISQHRVPIRFAVIF